MIAPLLVALHAHFPGVPIGLYYHPDADAGDGTGWCLEVYDLHIYGTLEEIAAKIEARWPDYRTQEVPR
jgi:hypothetical protein